MGEHVGAANYPTYVEVLRRAVRPGGRVLVQQMSRQGAGGGKHPGGGPFIESFIAPDMTMRPVGETVDLIESGGLEVRDVHAMREHYVLTVAGWIERFEANLPRLRELVGEEVVRVWRLYLVGGALAFRDGRMGVDQILSVRPGAAAHPPGRPPVVTQALVALLAALVVMGATAAVSKRVDRVAVVDVAWGSAFVVDRPGARARVARPRTPGCSPCWCRCGADDWHGTSRSGRRATARTRATRRCSAGRAGTPAPRRCSSGSSGPRPSSRG